MKMSIYSAKNFAGLFTLEIRELDVWSYQLNCQKVVNMMTTLTRR